MLNPKQHNQLQGRSGETAAAAHLTDLGYKIIHRNFRTKFGEADIIALHRGQLVIVEVKARSSLNYGQPEEAVGYRKLEHLKRVIEYFAQTHPDLPQSLRIDVVSVFTGKPAHIRIFSGVET